jgi:hypothetical protein
MAKFPSTTVVAMTVALGLVASSAAMAQNVDPAAVAGRWLYDASGHTIGSVIGAQDGGSTAKIMVGTYFRPGSHVASVPAAALYLSDGKVTVQTQTVQALNLQVRN